jgi:glycerol-1-phosphate dehydrogenase [NAD(P)+]
VATRAIVIAPSLLGREDACVADLALGRRLAVVSDPTTRAVLGDRVERALASRATVESIVLPEHPHADEATVARIADATRLADALIAVGSGTINDLCKLVAARAGKPYVVFATAPSMNGFVSTTASIAMHGHKQSLAAAAPVGAFFDLRILSQAPPRMIRSGLGDSLCRSTAQADWLLAHHVLGRPYRHAPFALLAEDESALFAESAVLMRGDIAVMERLVRTLLLSGFGTAICGSSHPASQGEHLISHYVDMLGDPSWPMAFHGEQIGVTTLTMARLQERMLAREAIELRDDDADEAQLVAIFGDELGRSCWAEYSAKRVDAAAKQRLLERWSDMRIEIGAVARPSSELEQVLRRAGAPTTPAELGWPEAFYEQAVRNARLIRNRFTFLDLVACRGGAESCRENRRQESARGQGD